MDLTIIERFGWVAAILLWIAPQAWKFFTERFFPQKMKERDAEQKRRDDETRAEREARAILIKAQIERENKDAERRLQLENRMVTTLEQLSLGITIGNERVAALIASHTQHANFTFGSHVEIKERLDDIQDMIVTKQRVDELERDLKDTKDKIKLRAEGSNE